MLIPVNLTGGTYKHKSMPLSAQSTINFIPQKQTDQKALSPYILESYPGKSLFGAATGGVNRGLFKHQDVLYHVVGTTIYTVATDGTHTSIGTIPGTGRCMFAHIGDYIVIEQGTTRYYWNGTTVAQITDSDLEAGTGIAHINNQILFGGSGGRFAVSDAGDATSIDALNYGTAEAEADDLMRPYSFNQVAYMFGTETIELWWNSGQGNPPFDRFDGGVINIGLKALHGIANDTDQIYFLGNDYQVYTLRGGASAVIDPILPEPLVREFRNYGDVSDAFGYCVKLDGQSFFVLTFPTAGKTWAYPSGGEWFQLSSGTTGGRDIADGYAFFNNQHIVSDYQNGNLYTLDDTVYDDNGDTIVRQRDSAPIHGGLLKAPGKELEMNRFELIMEKGNGLISGQGSDPVVMLSFSDDGGHTFGSEIWLTVGQEGAYTWKAEAFNLGRFESRIIRIKVSDPVYWSIYSAAADLEVCI